MKLKVTLKRLLSVAPKNKEIQLLVLVFVESIIQKH